MSPVNEAEGTISYESQQCIPCKKTEYVLDSNNSKYVCQPCPVGAYCDGISLFPMVNGSTWVADLQDGYYVLQSCPSGYELINTLPNSADFSYKSQMCLLCPASFYCLGGSEIGIACPTGTFSFVGANQSSQCFPVVLIVVTFTIQIARVELTYIKQTALINALAAAARCDPGKVIIDSMQGARRVMGSTNVICKIAAENHGEGQSISGALNQDSINVQLAKQGLPSCTLISILVLDNYSSNTIPIVAGVLGAIGGIGLIAGLVYFFKRGTSIGASRRLIGANVGTPANQKDLPHELRDKYEVVQVIGKGTFGVVLEAWQLTNNRRRLRRAVKLVHAQGRQLSDKEIRRLDREVLYSF